MRAKYVWISAVLLLLGASAGARNSVAPAARSLRLDGVSERTDRGRPTAIGSADFNEDGTPDLVRGHAIPGGAYLTLHFGDVGALFPRRGRATDAPPFVNPGREFGLSDAPELLSAGDFDGDGHSDIVTAALGGDRLSVLAGDGRGGFAPMRSLDLAGSVTAMLAGEIGRRDGLLDLIVGIYGRDGTGVLVFEGPGGALRNEPRFVGLPGRPESLAVDLLDPDTYYDIAVAFGSSLFVIHGQDQYAGSNTPGQARAWNPRVDRFDGPSMITAIASGDFAGMHARQHELAVLFEDRSIQVLSLDPLAGAESGWARWKTLGVGELPPFTPRPGAARSPDDPPAPFMTAARVGGKPAQDLVVIEPAAARLHVFAAEPRSPREEPKPAELSRAPALEFADEPVALLPMRLNQDALSDFVILTRGTESTLLIPSDISSVFTVTNLADSGLGSLRDAILEANLTPGPDSIEFNIEGIGPYIITPSTPLPAITEALTVDGYTQPGALANTVPAPGLSDAVLQIEIDGTLIVLGSGLVIDAGGSAVRGLVIRAFFLDDGITLNSNGNIIEGNYLGTDVTGTTRLGMGNGNGIQIYGANNTVGGTVAQARNLLSDNDDDGVDIQTATGIGNLIQGNFIGTNASGTDSLDNGTDGVQIFGGSNNVIGGTLPGAGNLISGNFADGVFISLGGAGNVVQGNLISTDVTGTLLLDNNGDGVALEGAPGNFIGGTSTAARNVISGNEGAGIFMLQTSLNQVQGNFIGTDITGTFAIGNVLGGIEIRDSADNTVGGTSAEARNVISGNFLAGIVITLAGASGNQVQGNYIGTDASGAAALGNASEGVRILNAPENIIGGPTAGHRNVISSNSRGVLVQSAGATGNLVLGNFIGTDAAGTADLGNTQQGVLIFDAPDNEIGGIDPGMGNLITGNDGAGVWIFGNGAIKNTVWGNSISANGLRGLDLGTAGVTANDVGDGDNGANTLQNFPVITSAELGASTTAVGGTINSVPDSLFRLEFFANAACDSSNHGEGAVFLGSAMVSTNASGNGTFSTSLATGSTGLPEITATATDPIGNTSEFSHCFTGSTCTVPAVFGERIRATIPGSLTWPTPQDVHYAKGILANVGSYATIADGVLLGALALDISMDTPTPGTGLYYLVRPEDCGSWQSNPGAEPGRDTVLP